VQGANNCDSAQGTNNDVKADSGSARPAPTGQWHHHQDCVSGTEKPGYNTFKASKPSWKKKQDNNATRFSAFRITLEVDCSETGFWRPTTAAVMQQNSTYYIKEVKEMKAFIQEAPNDLKSIRNRLVFLY
jgi:hypothetical protein